MSIELEQFSTLIASIYEAALDESRWDTALNGLVAAFGGGGCALLRARPDTGQPMFHIVDNPVEMVSSYNTYYRQLDPAAAAIERAPAGTVLTIDEVLPSEDRPRSEFFVDWCTPNDIGDAIFARFTDTADQPCWLVVSGRRRTRALADSGHIELMRLLVPHLQRATHTGIVVAAQHQQPHQMVADVLQQSPRPAVVLGRDGIVLAANRPAMTILAQADGLGIDRIGRLQATAVNTHAALVRRVAMASGAAGPIRSGATVTVPRPSGRRPYRVEVMPLGAASDAAVLVAIVDPAGRPEQQQLVWRRRFGLTPAEAAVAAAILRGHGLQSVAEELGVALSTVRTHQQHIFEKTQTHRQAELVRLLLTDDTGPLSGPDPCTANRERRR
ncbi:MAG TPA: LuxR C-terminal-related transcriptional regulator [Mycobacterium sp.]|nr:LuxR C-terminal-related transcriptional regulator [Mycobacterium sp.]